MLGLLAELLEYLLGDVAEAALERVRKIVMRVIFGISVAIGIAGSAGLLGLGTVWRVLLGLGAVYLVLDFVVNRPDIEA